VVVTIEVYVLLRTDHTIEVDVLFPTNHTLEMISMSCYSINNLVLTHWLLTTHFSVPWDSPPMGPLALKRSNQCSSVGGSTEMDTLLHCRTTSLLREGFSPCGEMGASPTTPPHWVSVRCDNAMMESQATYASVTWNII
jgi:hypothetical protein